MKKIIVLFTLTFALFFTNYLKAFNIDTDYLHVSGSTIGLKLDTNVQISGTYAVKVKNKLYKPWENKLQENDIITHINGTAVKSLDDILKVLSNMNHSNVSLQILRGNKKIDVNVEAVLKENNEYSLGLYIKDHLLGIGTLTYVLSEEQRYGALGHSINNDLGRVSGTIHKAEVTSLKRASNNEAGHKNAKIGDQELGNINSNEITGLHGDYDGDTSKMYLMKCKKQSEVKLGFAEILTCIDGNKIEKFTCEITDLKIQNKKDIKGIKIQITDSRLINQTGGIIRGMSGSPIIQDDMLIGAVTHVTLDDASIGYGIYIEFMLQDTLTE